MRFRNDSSSDSHLLRVHAIRHIRLRVPRCSLPFKRTTASNFTGQYTLPIAYQGISNFGFQTATNVRDPTLLELRAQCSTMTGNWHDQQR